MRIKVYFNDTLLILCLISCTFTVIGVKLIDELGWIFVRRNITCCYRIVPGGISQLSHRNKVVIASLGSHDGIAKRPVPRRGASQERKTRSETSSLGNSTSGPGCGLTLETAKRNQCVRETQEGWVLSDNKEAGLNVHNVWPSRRSIWSLEWDTDDVHEEIVGRISYWFVNRAAVNIAGRALSSFIS